MQRPSNGASFVKVQLYIVQLCQVAVLLLCGQEMIEVMKEETKGISEYGLYVEGESEILYKFESKVQYSWVTKHGTATELTGIWNSTSWKFCSVWMQRWSGVGLSCDFTGMVMNYSIAFLHAHSGMKVQRSLCWLGQCIVLKGRALDSLM